MDHLPLPSPPARQPPPIPTHRPHSLTRVVFLLFPLILSLAFPILAQPAPPTTFPTLSIPCTSSRDCTLRHPSLFCHPALGTCAARTCGISQGLACSLFNATTYCTSLTRDGTCSPRLARGKACNPALDVPRGQHAPVPAVDVDGFRPAGHEWVAQANAQCELGLYCHQHLDMCVGAETDPNQQFRSDAQLAPSGGAQGGGGLLGSVGNLLAVLGMAVFVCGCSVLTCGRMCGWQPGQKGGMRWGRVCCGLPRAVGRCVAWVCGRRKKMKGKGVKEGQVREKVAEQPGSVTVVSVPMQPSPAVAAAAAAGSISVPSPSITSNGGQFYDPRKQQAHLVQSQPVPGHPPFPPVAAVAMSQTQGYDPNKQQAIAVHHLHIQPGPHAQMHTYSPSTSSSSSHSHSHYPYAQPIRSASNHFDPRKQAAASGAAPPPAHHSGGGYVMATPTVAPPSSRASPHFFPPALPASTAHMQLGKHELDMAMTHQTSAAGYYATSAPPPRPQQGHQHAYVGSAALHPQLQQQVYYAGAGPPPPPQALPK